MYYQKIVRRFIQVMRNTCFSAMLETRCTGIMQEHRNFIAC